MAFSFTVCVATIKEFADTLTDEVKSDPKQIEEAFKVYCKTAKSKQQRLVSTTSSMSGTAERINKCDFHFSVLLLGRFGNISNRNSR